MCKNVDIDITCVQEYKACLPEFFILRLYAKRRRKKRAVIPPFLIKSPFYVPNSLRLRRFVTSQLSAFGFELNDFRFSARRIGLHFYGCKSVSGNSPGFLLHIVAVYGSTVFLVKIRSLLSFGIRAVDVARE